MKSLIGSRIKAKPVHRYNKHISLNKFKLTIVKKKLNHCISFTAIDVSIVYDVTLNTFRYEIIFKIKTIFRRELKFNYEI